MSDRDEDLNSERTALVLSQWPTLNEAWGCANCEGMFRSCGEHSRCPHCGSDSVFDVAAILSRENVEENVEPKLAMLPTPLDLLAALAALDAVLDEGVPV